MQWEFHYPSHCLTLFLKPAVSRRSPGNKPHRVPDHCQIRVLWQTKPSLRCPMHADKISHQPVPLPLFGTIKRTQTLLEILPDRSLHPFATRRIRYKLGSTLKGLVQVQACVYKVRNCRAAISTVSSHRTGISAPEYNWTGTYALPQGSVLDRVLIGDTVFQRPVEEVFILYTSDHCSLLKFTERSVRNTALAKSRKSCCAPHPVTG